MNPLRDMALFVEVARLKSFTRAAERLDMPTSSLSRRIAGFEQALGLKLFHRSSRHVELTQAGALYFERCQPIVEEAQAAHEALNEAAQRPAGRLRVSAPVGFGQIYLGKMLQEFARRWPQIRLEMEFSPRRVDLLAEPFDLAIRIGSLPDSGLIARRIASIEHALYAAPRLFTAKTLPRRPDALVHFPHLALLPSDTHWRLIRGDDARDVRIDPAHCLGSMNLLTEFVLGGFGIARLDQRIAAPHLKAGRLLRVLPRWAFAPVPVSIVSMHRELPTRVRVFVDFLKAQFAEPT